MDALLSVAAPIIVFTIRAMYRFIWLVFLLCIVSGCSISLVTIDTMRNQPMDAQSEQKKIRAQEHIATESLSDGVFIGITLSGGGSRAANFSSAVLLELEKIGILNKTTAISSVSGSSLPAAYYGLYGRDKKRWNEKAVRHQMGKDFEIRWLGRWFLPHNILLYWYTNYNRSDIMKEALDANLFHGRTFADMGDGFPRILINATTLSEGKRFVFSEDRFRSLHSRIDTFPVANAVMASSAYPGAFHDMTLKNYAVTDQEQYEHIIDAGPSDNLGTTTLLSMVSHLYREPVKPKGCFLFVVDAYPAHVNSELSRLADTREYFDFFYARNVSAASDALLSARRIDLLNQLNIYPLEPGMDPFQPNTGPDAIYPDPSDHLQVECAVWHLSLQRLYSGEFGGDVVQKNPALKKDISELSAVVNSIPTRYKLTGDGPSDAPHLDSDALQESLFKAAHYLLYVDRDENGNPILEQVCNWFIQKGIRDLQCDVKEKTGLHQKPERALEANQELLPATGSTPASGGTTTPGKTGTPRTPSAS
ncbi:MAG: patatin-like phospholipase family protein [Nitrospirota bacterium]